MAYDFTLILIGFVALIGGAELCVRGASQIATRLGVSKVLIGLTVVAFGTSLPEMVVSFIASIHGEPSIAVGNVIGSNIANITLILGCAALLSPLMTDRGILRKEIPLMILSAIIIFLFSLSGRISRLEGGLLLMMFVGFLVISLGRYKQEASQAASEGLPERSCFLSLMITVGGFAILVLGGHWVVEGGKAVARGFGVSEWLIGLTIVALGTSLPELATSMVAAYKGEMDISVGNVIGSNLFNSFCVLGGAAVISPPIVNQLELSRDILLMVLVSAIIYPIARSKMQISRLEGLGLFVFYISFIISLIIAPEWRIF
ncbi:calcium/sodium antiporter [bacterium]|nr:calcium/sodium antiporter [bacterium]